MRSFRKKLFFILILLAIALYYFLSGFFASSPKHQTPQTQETTRYVESGNIDEVSFYGDRNQYILAKGFDFIGGRYLLGLNYNETKEKDDDINKEYISFRYYDVNDGLKEYTVDLLKELKRKSPQTYPRSDYGNNFGIIEGNGQNLIWLRYYESPDAQDYSEIYYDFNKREFIDAYRTKGEMLTIDSIIISYTNFSQLVVDRTGYNINSIIVQNSYKKERDNNLNIFSENPELKEKIADKNYTLYLRQGLMSDSEYFDTLLHWFAPKGQETLSGVKIDAYYSIDGQEHEIHSYEEFKQYYNRKGGELSE